MFYQNVLFSILYWEQQELPVVFTYTHPVKYEENLNLCLTPWAVTNQQHVHEFFTGTKMSL